MSFSELLPVQSGLSGFFTTELASFESKLKQAQPIELMNEGNKLRIELFKKMANEVPAYKDFLEKNNVDSSEIQTTEDLNKVPVIDKKNYLRAYDLDQLCWNGNLRASSISSSSGSSGTPTFWPRSEEIETETTFIFEFFLKNLFSVKQESTLFISCFAMGVYVGGSFTLNCCTRLNQKGYPITIVTPGISKKDALNCFHSLAKFYDHIILGGYPPLVKDILDELEQSGTKLSDYKISFQFAAESISEDFRSYMYKRVGVPDEEYLSRSMNLYGTADAAVAGHETRSSILLRKLLNEQPEICQKHFGSTTVPSVNAYYPFFKQFEVVNNELVFSSRNNAIPLCRYNIHDAGGILSYNDQLALFNELGLSEEEVRHKVGADYLWKLPFVYLHGKSDNTVTLYGLLIYTETIKQALEHQELEQYITGKFVMKTALNKNNDQYLHIYLEKRPNIATNETMLSNQAKHEIIASLIRNNAEYATLYQSQPGRSEPHIELCCYEDQDFFPADIKHRWVKK